MSDCDDLLDSEPVPGLLFVPSPVLPSTSAVPMQKCSSDRVIAVVCREVAARLQLHVRVKSANCRNQLPSKVGAEHIPTVQQP